MSTTAAAPRPSPEKIFDALTRYQQTFALKSAIEIGLFTSIGEGANEPVSLAKRTQCAERGVRILADYLVIQGFLTKENGTYALTPDSAVFLDKRSPAYMGAMSNFLVSDENIARAIREAPRETFAVIRRLAVNGRIVSFSIREFPRHTVADESPSEIRRLAVNGRILSFLMFSPIIIGGLTALGALLGRSLQTRSCGAGRRASA